MVNINDAFPGQYLRAADLKGQPLVLTIREVKVEVFEEGRKLILFFQGRDQGLVLNKTNAYEIGRLYGEETDGWAGRHIELFPSRTDFKGKMVDAIRVREPSGEAAAALSVVEDEIPF